MRLQPKPETRNSKLETRNPKLQQLLFGIKKVIVPHQVELSLIHCSFNRCFPLWYYCRYHSAPGACFTIPVYPAREGIDRFATLGRSENNSFVRTGDIGTVLTIFGTGSGCIQVINKFTESHIGGFRMRTRIGRTGIHYMQY